MIGWKAKSLQIQYDNLPCGYNTESRSECMCVCERDREGKWEREYAKSFQRTYFSCL